MPTDVEMDLPDHRPTEGWSELWRGRAETAEAEARRLKAENERLRRQNRELVTEIAIRSDVISTLQNSSA